MKWRKEPEINSVECQNCFFFGDDTLDYLEIIDKSLKGGDENTIKNPTILPKRQKR